MAQPLLAIQHRSGAAPQVYRVAGASPSPLGDPIVASVEGTSNDNMSNWNRVIQFQGDVYAAVNGGVYKKDDPTMDAGAWSSDHAFTNFTALATNQHAILGPYQFVENGTEKLFVCWHTDTNATSWNASILDGGTGLWADVGEQSSIAPASNEDFGSQIMYRGVLHAQARTSQEMLTFDPLAQSFGIISLNGIIGGESQTSGLAVFNDRLLVFGRNASTGALALAEISGTVNILFDTAFAALVSNREHRNLLVPSPDGSVLYAFAITSTGGTGSVCLKMIDTAGVLSFSSNLTSAVIPAGLQPGSGAITNRWWAFYDQETTPGSAALRLFFAPDGNTGSTVTQYSFVDESTTLVQDDVGASAAWAFTNVTTGGGERIFTPGELHIEIVDRLAVIGGEAVRFKAWGAAGADKKVDFRFNTQTEVPLSQATLIGTPTVVSGAAPAPTRNVNTLEGVTADGSTVYQTIWDVGTDGLVSGQRAQLVPRIFV